MATKGPARNWWGLQLQYALHFDMVRSRVYPSADYLEISSDGAESPVEVCRMALQFADVSAPSWAASLTEVRPLLFLHQLSKHYDGGGEAIYIAQISDPWTTASSYATMAALTLGAWQGPYTAANVEHPYRSGIWLPYDIDDQYISFLINSGGYGIMIKTTSTGPGGFRVGMRIAKSGVIAPTARAYYRREMTGITVPLTGSRTDLDAETVRLISTPAAKHRRSLTVLSSVTDPSAAADVTTILGSSGDDAVIDRSCNWPQAWLPGDLRIGSLSVPLGTRGGIDSRVSVGLVQQVGNRPAVTVATQYGAVRSRTVTRSGITLEIGDALSGALDAAPLYRDVAAGAEDVQWDAEVSILVLLDALVNAGGWRNLVRTDDVYWILQRFGTVWPTVTYSVADLEGLTVGDIVAKMAQAYGACLSVGADGKLTIWHPAAYRPSLRVWTQDVSAVTDLTYRDAVSDDDGYGEITLSYGGDGGGYYSGAIQTGAEQGQRVYDAGVMLNTELEYSMARTSLCRQLGRRLAEPREIVTFRTGPRACEMEAGDQIILSGLTDALGLTDDSSTWLITGIVGEARSGQYRITCYRYAGNPAMHSTFRLASEVMGVWRWLAWTDPTTWTGANMWPGGTAGTWTLNGTMQSSLLIDWRGPLIGYDADSTAIEAPATFFPTDTAGVCDVLDMVVGVYGIQASDPPAPWLDVDYIQLLRIGKSTTTEAVVLAIYRPLQSWTTGDVPSTITNCLILGHTLDWTASPITWAASILGPPGVGIAGVGAPEDDYRVHAVALRWMDTGLELLVDNRVIGSMILAKTGYDEAFITTPVHGEHKVGCVRWLKSTSLIDDSRLFGLGGDDEYYP